MTTNYNAADTNEVVFQNDINKRKHLEMRLLTPIFTAQHETYVESLQEISPLYHSCPGCDCPYDSCCCNIVESITMNPTANYRVHSTRNDMFRRHQNHKRNIKQLMRIKDDIVPQSGENFDIVPQGSILEFFLGLQPKSLSHLMEESHDTVAQIKEFLPEAAITMETFNESLGKIQETIIKTGKEINGACSTFSDIKDMAILSACFGTGLFWAYDYMKPSRMSSFLINLIIARFLLSDKMRDIMSGSLMSLVSFVAKYFSKEEVIKPQFGADDIADVAGMLSTGLGLYSMSAVNKNFSSSFKNILVDSTRVKRGLEDCMKSVVKCFEFVVNMIRTNFFELPGMRLFDSSNTIVDEFLDELKELHLLESAGNFARTPNNFDKVNTLIMRGTKIVKEVPRDRNSEGFLKLVNDEMRFLKDLSKIYQNLNFKKQGIRQEPVGILLQGGAGVGKSITVMHIVNALCGLLLDDEEYKEFVSSVSTKVNVHCPENGFWDGYRQGSLVTIIDDFGQATDVAGNPDNEFVKTIRAVNAFEYIMHMASLEQKGTTYFDSKFFLCTTNVKKFQPTSIVSADALNRRFPARFIVSIADEYCTPETVGCDYYVRKLDPTKLPIASLDGDNYSSLNPEVQIFVPSNADGVPCGSPITFDDFIDHVMILHNQRELWQVTQDAEFKSTRDKYREVYKQNQSDDMYRELQDYLDSSDSDDDDIYMETVPQSSGCFAPEVDVDLFLDNVYSYYTENELSVAQLLFDSNKEKTEEFFKFVHSYLPGITIFSELHLLLICNKFFGDKYAKSYRRKPLAVLKKDIRWNYENIMSYMPMSPPRSGIINNIKKQYDLLKAYVCGELLYTYDKHGFMAAFKQFAVYSPFVFIGVSLVTAALAGSATYAFCKSILKLLGFSVATIPESLSSDKMHAPKPVKGSYVVSMKDALAMVRPQAITDVDKSGYELATSILKKSWFKAYFERSLGSNDFTLLGGVFNVKGKIMKMPYHFIRKFLDAVAENPARQDCKVKFVKGLEHDVPSAYVFTVGDIIRGHRTGVLQENDMVLVQLPRTFPSGANRLANFGSRKDYDRYARAIPMVMRTPATETDVVFGGFADAVENTQVVYDTNIKYTVRTGYSYHGFTNGGDCGAMLILLDNKNPSKKFFGMHVAGLEAKSKSARKSYAAAICVEDIEEDLKMFSEDFEIEEFPVAESNIVFGEGKFETIGKPARSPNAVLISAIVHSPLHGMFGPVNVGHSMLKPTLVDGELVDPFKNALKKYCNNPNKEVDEFILNKAATDYTEMLLNLSIGHETRLLNTRDILDGSDFLDELKSLTSSTSPGFPMNIQGFRNLKKEYYSAIDKDIKDRVFDEIDFEVQTFISKMKNGILPSVIYTDNLKDERRSWEKIKSGSTRLFSGCPFIYLLVVKKYFGDFALAFQSNMIANESAIGVNPYSLDWDNIAKHLNTFGSDKEIVNKGAGDYTAFDGSQIPVMQYKLLDIINIWYSDEHSHMRSMLFESVVFSQHIYRGIIYAWKGSLPSGHALTAMLNTMYNSLAFRCAWYTQNIERPPFNTQVKLILLGDDNAFAVHPDFSSFNELVLPELMSQWGLIYTPEDKKSLLVHPARRLDQLEFLKRKFKLDETYLQYVAPLRFSVLEEMIQFSKRGSTSDKICVDNCIIAIREASLHSKEEYDNFSSKVVAAVTKALPFVTPSEPWIMSYNRRKDLVLKSDTFFL